MDRRTCNSVLACGILAGLISLPLTWFTLRSAPMSQMFGGNLGIMLLQEAGIGNGPIRLNASATGFTGSFEKPIAAQFWFFVVLGIAAAALQFLRDSKHFAIPALLEGGLSLLAPLSLAIFSLVLVASHDVSIGIGLILAAFCVTTPLVCIFCERRDESSVRVGPNHDAAEPGVP